MSLSQISLKVGLLEPLKMAEKRWMSDNQIALRCRRSSSILKTNFFFQAAIELINKNYMYNSESSFSDQLLKLI